MGSVENAMAHTHSVWGNDGHGRRKLGAGANSGVVDTVVFLIVIYPLPSS